MKIYLLKIWHYDPSSFDDNGDVDGHEGYDGWEMIDYDNYSYEIEELEVIED